MSLGSAAWETRLLALALEGMEGSRGEAGEFRLADAADEALLERAFAECEQITRQHSRTFYMASGLLPPAKRLAARVLYAFCRITDDLVDRRQERAPESLETWARLTLAELPERNNAVALAWHVIRQRYQIPLGYAQQLIEGVALDLVQARYETFDDLVAYCYGVASTVGLMSMHIIGFSGPEAVPYAVRLGVALQLTNILRDVGEDWRKGRLYLPLEELRQFGLEEGDIERGDLTERWREFMRFQIERARRIYASALPGIQLLHPDGRFSIAAAAHLYQAILDKIEENHYDVFRRRAFVGKWDKMRRLPWIWQQSRQGARWAADQAIGKVCEMVEARKE